MKLKMVGISHHNSTVEARERLAFSDEQARTALGELRNRFPEGEAVLLSTCNRVELYVAAENGAIIPSQRDIVQFLAEFHGISPDDLFEELFEQTDEEAVRHLFTVAAGLDSMVVGEPQILAQVKEAYQLASQDDSTGPLTHAVFQSAIKAARRVSRETAINEKRISIPSVAVGDFARRIFETFQDKHVLLIGAGDMGEETLRYLVDEGARQITIINRNLERAEQLAKKLGGQVEAWDRLDELLIVADVVVSTTGAQQPIVTRERFQRISPKRYQRPLFVLDLAVPRDFEPAVGDCLGVYLYSIDDLKATCDENRRQREKELPKARRIIEEETARFMTELHHRATGPTIRRFKDRAEQIKQEELTRLLNKLGDIDDRHRVEIEQTLGRLVNKLLHPPLETLRDEAESGAPHGLLEALKTLFKLRD